MEFVNDLFSNSAIPVTEYIEYYIIYNLQTINKK